MDTKICTKCGRDKKLALFGKRKAARDGRRSQCKQCDRADKLVYRTSDKGKKVETAYVNSEERKEVLRKYSKTEKFRDSQARYRVTDKRKQVANNYYYRHKQEPKYHLDQRTYDLVRHLLKGRVKTSPALERRLGYSGDELRRRIEATFKEGMCWSLYFSGKIEVDHIVPLSAWKYEKDTDPGFKKAWALSNMQALWRKDNLRKYNKLDTELEDAKVRSA